ncbi:hypothetical protein RvY_08547 [Ramazzottius varieornatus]|uniref:G-protein coupled receptors family 1 profile domain-containing protein n=1 Tax=Ramazzottius varieornatus TaxID=947166 RepID=A0A1D1VFF5_RAMVA|nr:hypothetical protein RvY_08547 [Ramazzottius varieornatus]
MDLNSTLTITDGHPVQNPNRNGTFLFHSSTNLNVSSNTTFQGVSQSTYSLMVTVLVTNAIGVPANLLMLAAIVTYQPLRRSKGVALLIQCVVIDILLSAIVGPISSIILLLGPRHALPPMFCRLGYSLINYTIHPASLYAMALTAVQRLCATLFPLTYRRLFTRKSIAAMILLPRLIAFTLSAFPAAAYQVQMVRSPATGGCFLVPVVSNGKTMLVYITMSIYLPTSVTCDAYVILLLRSWLLLRREKQNAGNNKGKLHSLQHRLGITRGLFLSFLWHCLAIYPFALMVTFFPEILSTSSLIGALFRWMTLSFATMNPVSTKPITQIHHFRGEFH